jgi:hypothetical protein
MACGHTKMHKKDPVSMPVCVSRAGPLINKCRRAAAKNQISIIASLSTPLGPKNPHEHGVAGRIQTIQRVELES